MRLKSEVEYLGNPWTLPIHGNPPIPVRSAAAHQLSPATCFRRPQIHGPGDENFVRV